MTRTSIKIIYLTILWTLTCPFLQCFSLLNPLNYIPLLTCIQPLQAISIKMSEESYDKINEDDELSQVPALRDNPNLLKQLIAQYGSQNSKFQSPKGAPVMNGVSSNFPSFGTGMYSVKNPVTVPLPNEFIYNGQKYIVTNRLSLLGNFFKKVTSAITSPISSSFDYFKKLGQNQVFQPDALKSISNRLKISNRNDDDEEEEKPKKSRKKKSKDKKNTNKKGKNRKKGGDYDEEDDEETGEEEEVEEEEEERQKKSRKKKSKDKKNTNKKAKKKKEAKEEEEEEEKDDDEDEEETKESNKKGKNRKKEGDYKEEDDEESGESGETGETGETRVTDEEKNPKKNNKRGKIRKRNGGEDESEEGEDDDEED